MHLARKTQANWLDDLQSTLLGMVTNVKLTFVNQDDQREPWRAAVYGADQPKNELTARCAKAMPDTRCPYCSSSE